MSWKQGSIDKSTYDHVCVVLISSTKPSIILKANKHISFPKGEKSDEWDRQHQGNAGIKILRHILKKKKTKGAWGRWGGGGGIPTIEPMKSTLPSTRPTWCLRKWSANFTPPTFNNFMEVQTPLYFNVGDMMTWHMQLMMTWQHGMAKNKGSSSVTKFSMC